MGGLRNDAPGNNRTLPKGALRAVPLHGVVGEDRIANLDSGCIEGPDEVRFDWNVVLPVSGQGTNKEDAGEQRQDNREYTFSRGHRSRSQYGTLPLKWRR